MLSYTGAGTALQELMYGFIMALIFVYGTRFGVLEFSDVVTFSLTVIGMCVTWGVIDGIIFYYIWKMDARRQMKIISNEDNMPREERLSELMDYFDGTALSIVSDKDVERICNDILDCQVESAEEFEADRKKQIQNSIGCAFFGSIPVIPVLIPLYIIDDLMDALFASCLVSSVLLFIIGYSMAKYIGTNKFLTGAVLAGISLAISVVSVFTGG